MSVISVNKRQRIIDSYNEIICELKRYRKAHRTMVSEQAVDLCTPAWVRVNPAPPIEGKVNCYRLCIGFRNIGCKYRDRDRLGLGCLNCGYYANTAFREVDNETILKQLKLALQLGHATSTEFSSIEFLNDGSFLNQEEFRRELQSELMGVVAKMPRIKRVLVESKSEYITRSGVEFLLERVRDDQLLEIGIGFESADEFIRNVCINKGFENDEFEAAIRTLSELDAAHAGRVSVVAYLLVKPAFLSHKESIEDVVSSLRYLYSLSKKYGIDIVPKLEPAAIVSGTILSMLYGKKDSEFYYEPLNYWAILEILARVAVDGECHPLLETIRVGAREDMDDIIRAPAIYDRDKDVYHPFDFVVYESIQKFNQHHDVYKLFSVLVNVYRHFNDGALVGEGAPFKEWLCEKGIEDDAVSVFVNDWAMKIEKCRSRDDVAYEIDNMVMAYSVLDILEGYDEITGRMKEDVECALIGGDKEELERAIERCYDFMDKSNFVKVSINSMSVEEGIGEVFFDVVDLLKGITTSIWSRFEMTSARGAGLSKAG